MTTPVSWKKSSNVNRRVRELELLLNASSSEIQVLFLGRNNDF